MCIRDRLPSPPREQDSIELKEIPQQEERTQKPLRWVRVLARVTKHNPPERDQTTDLDDTLAAVNGTPRTTINIKINANETQALLDTGASLTLIDTNWAEQHQIHIEPNNQTATSINGTTIKLKGKAQVTFQIGPISLSSTVVIMDNSVTPCVLGVDLLKRLGPFQLDYNKKQVVIGNSQLPLNQETGFYSRVSMTETIEIPPHSAAMVRAKLDISPTVRTALFEPNTKHPGQSVRRCYFRAY